MTLGGERGMAGTNTQVILAAYPEGLPKESDFRVVTAPMPEPGEGEFLVRSLLLSLDPWQRLRMRPPIEFGRQYGRPIQPGELVPGAILGEVIRSRHPHFKPGEIVEGKLGWQSYAVSTGSGNRVNDAEGVTKIDPSLGPLSTALGVLGRTGMSAYFALLDLARPKPGETVVVTAAAGATGSIVGQLAKLAGCRAVGLAGSEAKIRHIVDELGFDAGVNYTASADLSAALKEAGPDGIDIYIDNVGGPVADAMLEQMNDWARWVVVGQIAEYDKAIHEYRGLRPQGYVLAKRLRMEGFVIHDYAPRFPEAQRRMSRWIKEGRLQYREHIVKGLENAPRAFIDMLQGKNIGKALVQIGPLPA